MAHIYKYYVSENYKKQGFDDKKELDAAINGREYSVLKKDIDADFYQVFIEDNTILLETQDYYRIIEKFYIHKDRIDKIIKNNEFVKISNYDVPINIRKIKKSITVEYYNFIRLRKSKENHKKGIIPEDKREIIENLPGEVWKMIPDGFNYNWCSNKGRFKIVDAEGNEQLRKPVKSMGGRDHNREYHDITLKNPNGGKGIICRTSRAIAKTFIDPTLDLNTTKNAPRKVDHWDNDPTNEKLENLRILSHSENLLAAFNEQGVVRKGGVMACRKCYAEKDGERREYNTTAALVRDITGKNNNGYFQTAMLAKKPQLRGWKIGYID